MISRTVMAVLAVTKCRSNRRSEFLRIDNCVEQVNYYREDDYKQSVNSHGPCLPRHVSARFNYIFGQARKLQLEATIGGELA